MLDIFLFALAFTLSVATYGQSGFAVVGSLLSILIFVFFIFLQINQFKNIKLKLTILNTFIFCIVVANFRTNYEMSILWKMFHNLKLLLFCFSAFLFFGKKRNAENYLIILATFVVINFFLSIINYDPFRNTDRGDSIGNSILLNSLFKIDIARITFPLTGGVNNYGTYVGAIVLMSLVYLMNNPKKDIFFFSISGTIIAGVYTILRLDTRFVLVILVSLIFIFFLKKKHFFTKIIKMSFYLLLITPVLLVIILNLLVDTEISDYFSRGNQDFLTGNGRFIIWAFCIEDLLNFNIKHLLGYGYAGHYGSGLSYSWIDIFKYSYAEPEKATTHSNLLQIIFDMGYIGLGLFILLIRKCFFGLITLFSKTKQLFYLPFIFYILYIIGAGTTEALFSDISNIYLFLFIIIGIYSLLENQNNQIGKKINGIY